ncbi:MAG: glycosyltransferase [Verrucomicrobia bacterium]|nr:glycosyltransferase [Verrucomicrobiota bacterium]
MNVVHVFPYPPRVRGGHSNAIRSFIACQQAKGINAVGIAQKADAEVGDPDWDFPLAEVDSLWELRWAGIADRFDLTSRDSLLHLHGVNRKYASLLGDLRRVGVPYVLTSHGQLGFPTAWRWLLKFVYLNVVNRGPLKAAGLQVLATFAVQRAKLLLPGFRGKILVQGNLVHLPKLADSPPALRSDYGLPRDAFVLIFVGRLDVRVKGLDLVVEAFSRLPSKRPRLLLVGPDWSNGKAELERLAESLGCRDRVLFTGPIHGDKKWSLLQMADLFVSPSRWDAFNIALAEAMAVGLPVVTSTKVSLAPDLRQAGAALLAPPAVEQLAQAIAALVSDPERRRTLGTRGKAWAEENCDPGRAGTRFRDFYQSILDQRPGAGG